jgi:heme O synthase-like polyprenyltransferase
MNDFFAKAVIEGSKIGVPATTAASARGILNTVYFWAAIVAVIGVLIGAFLYVTSNGNSQQVEQAKNSILASVIGLVIVFSAFLITTVVLGGF